MKQEAQRIAIAKACGYTCITPPHPGAERLYQIADPSGKVVGHVCESMEGAWETSALPDYLGDLNEMHEAENILKTPEQRTKYAWQDALGDDYCECLMSTAARRAEALLRTIGKWTYAP